MTGNSNFSAPVSTQAIKTLEISDGDDLSPEKILEYCDEVLQVAETNEELHRATRIFDMISNSAKRTLKIYLKKRKKMVFEYPEDLDLDFKDETNGIANWKKVKEWELK